jgi:hypothetical protein
MNLEKDSEVTQVDLEVNVEVIEVQDLEPITIGEVTELTGSGTGGHGDKNNIVWGS